MDKEIAVADEMKSICDLELMILPVYSNDQMGNDLGQQFNSLKDSYHQHAKSVFAVERDLRDFYASLTFKIARYRKEQGEKAEVGRAIGGMLRTARLRAKDRRVMVVIGDGDFKGRNGAPVMANKFISRLQSQAKGEGMLVCCVDEFRTSISCCNCHQRVKTKGRSVICPDFTCGGLRPPTYDLTHKLDTKAGLERDRDHNAGQNMANAALKWVNEFEWPVALGRKLAKQEAPCGMVQIHIKF
ncbi:hypothetical protein BGX27_004528 [Mortierella sp. AM989]|nr:hypothetical protein BGX27_004528 [Mortierella sp. AM989]